MAITRTIKLDDLRPEEVAGLFTEMDSDDQAAFFNEVWRIARAWPGAGWCQQACGIVQSAALNKDGRDALRALADHLTAYEEEAA